jgi:hypothetical protein
MSIRTSLVAYFLAALSVSAAFGEPLIAEVQPDPYKVLRQSLAEDTEANRLVQQIVAIVSSGSVAPLPQVSSQPEVVEVLPFAYDISQFDAEEMGWREYCGGQRIVAEKLQGDWKQILASLQQYAEAAGVSIEDVENGYYEIFDNDGFSATDPFSLWLEFRREAAIDDGYIEFFSIIGAFYGQLLAFEVENEPCRASARQLTIGIARLC